MHSPGIHVAQVRAYQVVWDTLGQRYAISAVIHANAFPCQSSASAAYREPYQPQSPRLDQRNGNLLAQEHACPVQPWFNGPSGTQMPTQVTASGSLCVKSLLFSGHWSSADANSSTFRTQGTVPPVELPGMHSGDPQIDVGNSSSKPLVRSSCRPLRARLTKA